MEQSLRRAITSGEDTNDFRVLLKSAFPITRCDTARGAIRSASKPDSALFSALLSPIQILMSSEKNVALFSFPFLSEITFWREKATK